MERGDLRGKKSGNFYNFHATGARRQHRRSYLTSIIFLVLRFPFRFQSVEIQTRRQLRGLESGLIHSPRFGSAIKERCHFQPEQIEDRQVAFPLLATEKEIVVDGLNGFG